MLRSHGNAGCGPVKYSLRQERKPKRYMAFEGHSLRDNAGIAINLQHLISQNGASQSGLCGVFSWAVDSLSCLASGRRRHHDDVAVAVAPRRPVDLFRLPHGVLPLPHGAPEDTTAIDVVVLGLVTMMYRLGSGRRCHHPDQDE